MEKLLVCDALDERDFLRKKIFSAIQQAKFVGAKRKKDELISGKYVVDDFSNDAKAQLQSIKDMIKRYQDIDSAITLSNATTDIKTRSGKVMKVASAIALRKSLRGNSVDVDFIGSLIDTLSKQFVNASNYVREYNANADRQAELLRQSFVGKDTQKKISEEDAKTVEALTAGLCGEMIDPIEIEKELASIREDHDTLIKELETAIKVSNATTYIKL